jgi:hypothetical protein
VTERRWCGTLESFLCGKGDLLPLATVPCVDLDDLSTTGFHRHLMYIVDGGEVPVFQVMGFFIIQLDVEIAQVWL